MKAKLYIKPTCPFCIRAVSLLQEKNIESEVIDVSKNPELRAEVSESVGGFRTVPMIFLDEKFIGGFSDLQALDTNGSL